MEEPVSSATAHWVPMHVLEEPEEVDKDEFMENMQSFDKQHSCGNDRLTASCREVGLGYVAQELVDYPHEDVDQFDGGYGLPEHQVDYAERADYAGQVEYAGQREDGASDGQSVSSDMLMTQAVDAEASLRAEILDLGRRMRGAPEPGMREREFLAASNSNGYVVHQDIGSCASFDSEPAVTAASAIDEVGMPPVANGWSHEDHEEPAEIRPGLRGLAAAAGGPVFCDYLVDGDDDLGLDTPEAIWRPPLMRRPPDRPVAAPGMANGGSAASYSSIASREEAGVFSVQSSPRKPPPESATATPRPRGRGRAGAAPPMASSGGSAESHLGGGGGGGGGSSASAGSDAVRRSAVLERARQPHASREECNRAPQGMQPRGARPARSAEVQALQAEVAMQEVQLRRLLTAQPGENIPDEVAFEAARLWQGLESIRSVIGTLQERIGEEGSGLQEEMLSTSDAGFVEDAYVVKADNHSQGSRGRMSLDGSPDGFDEIARLEAATSILTRQPRGRHSAAAAGLAPEERRQAPERQGAFRGLVRGSGTGGGASTRVSNTSVKRQDTRPSTPLKQSPRQHGMPGKFSARRSGGGASQVSSAVNIGVGSVTGSGGGAAFGGTRLKSPTRERRSVSAPRGTTARRAASPAPKAGSRPASPRSSSTMRRATSPAPKTGSRPTSPRSPRGQAAANSGGLGRAAAVGPHTPPPPPKRSPMDGRDHENLPRRGGAGTPHSPSSQHSVVVRASGSAPGAASYWKHTGVAPVVLHGGAAADHAVLAGVPPIFDSGGLGTPSDSGVLVGGAAAPPMPL
mmetsp:Transcript_41728/g.73349  ORF Transcript_41728/g.73349 Transcript_41728/m.73349 type:complete len:801 (-) Transcript_41728:142-2544(-)